MANAQHKIPRFPWLWEKSMLNFSASNILARLTLACRSKNMTTCIGCSVSNWAVPGHSNLLVLQQDYCHPYIISAMKRIWLNKFFIWKLFVNSIFITCIEFCYHLRQSAHYTHILSQTIFYVPINESCSQLIFIYIHDQFHWHTTAFVTINL